MYGFFYASASVLGIAQFCYAFLFVMAWFINKEPYVKILWFCFSLFIGPLVSILFFLNSEGYIPNSWLKKFGLEEVNWGNDADKFADPKYKFINSKFESQILF